MDPQIRSWLNTLMLELNSAFAEVQRQAATQSLIGSAATRVVTAGGSIAPDVPVVGLQCSGEVLLANQWLPAGLDGQVLQIVNITPGGNTNIVVVKPSTSLPKILLRSRFEMLPFDSLVLIYNALSISWYELYRSASAEVPSGSGGFGTIGTLNDFLPSGSNDFLNGVTNWELFCSAGPGPLTITGIDSHSGFDSYRVLRIINVGSFNIVLKHENAGSAAINRFHFASGADMTIAPTQFLEIIYQSSLARWLNSL